MSATFYSDLDKELAQIKADGLWKSERLISTDQSSDIGIAQGSGETQVLNF